MKTKKIKKKSASIKTSESKTRQKKIPVQDDPFFYQRALLDHLRDFAIGLDRKGIIRYINPAFAYVLRERTESIIGHPITEYEKQFTMSVSFAEILKETLAKSRWSGNVTATRSDGKRFYYSFRTYAVSDRFGHIVGLVGIAEDISQSVLEEERLSHRESHIPQWCSSVLDGIFMIRNGRFVYANQAFAEMLGYQPEEMISPDFQIPLLCADKAQLSLDKQIKVHANGNKGTIIIPLRAKKSEPEDTQKEENKANTEAGENSSWIYVEISYLILSEENSEEIFAIVRNVSTTYRRLTTSARWFEELFEKQAVGIAVTDVHGYMLLTNSVFQQMVGFNEKELRELRASDITHPEDFEMEVQHMRELIGNPELNFYRSVKRYIRKDGRIVWVRLSAIPIRNRDKQIERIVGIIEDITEQKYTERLIRIQHDLSLHLSVAEDLESAMDYVLERSMDIEEIHAGCVFMADRWGHIHFLAQKHLSPVMAHKLPALPIEILRQAFFSQSAPLYLRYPDFIFHIGIGYDEDLKHEEYESAVILPVRYEEKTIAVIVLFSMRFNSLGAESREVLESVSALLGGIVARLRTLDALTHSEERYRRLLESATDYVVTVTVSEGQPIKSYHGERCVTVTGYTPEDYEHDPYLWYNMIYPEDQPAVSELVRRVLRGEKVPPLEHRIYHKDGSVRWIRHTVVSRYNSRGELIGYDALISDITERKNAEQLLTEQEEYYRAIFEGAPIGIFLETFDGRILNVNQAACTMLGYTAEELKSMHVTKLVPEEYHSAISFLQSMDDQKPVIIGQNICKDGRRIWVEVIRQIVNINNRLLALVFVQDISERQRSEAELMLQNTRFQQLFDNNPLAMVMVDENDCVQMVNSAFTQIFQYTKEEALYQPINSLIVPDHLMEEAAEISRKTQQHQALESETVRRCKDGSLVDVHIWGVPIMLSHNQIGVFGIYADITERKRAERIIQESEEKYRALFEESKDMVYISTPEGYFLDVNSAGVRMFGYDSREDMLRVLIPDAIYLRRQDRETFQQIVAEQGYVQDYEVSLKRKDGSPLEALITATAVRNDHGDIIAYRGIIRDITAYKQLQRQLIQAQKMESIGTLSGGIAHDFNNLLAVVLSTAELIRKRAQGNEDLIELTDMIINSAMRGRSITRQLLLFSRSDNPILRTLSLNTVIAENVKLLEHTLPKSITIHHHALTSHDTILGDLSHLHQIILNLAINARDAMPEGGTITIVVDRVPAEEILKKWPEGKDHDYIALYFSDNGSGIPPEIQTRIFDPFFTTKEQGRGTGLGLSIVHGIVINHQGFIEFDSQPGQGTTFRIYFPAHDQSRMTENPFVSETKATSGYETILIVDDEPSLLVLLRDILEMSGYQVLSAQNGVEAIRLYHEHAREIDLLITDIGMPEMDGIKLYKHLKEIAPDLPIIISTGYMGDLASQNLKQEGINDVILKPYSVSDILNTIRHVLDNKPRL